MTTRIAIVTPSYNQGRFLRRTIESVVSQDVDGLEYMVVDGGSDDESVEILRGYGERLSWVSEKDRGQAHAVNKGITATRAPVIGWLNSDDVYCASALKRVLEEFAERPEIDVLYGKAMHIDENDGVLAPYPTEPWNIARLMETCFICQPAVFFRRRVVEQWGALDETLHYAMDYEYWIRLGRGGAQFLYLDEVLAGSRMYPQNKTLGSRLEVHAEINDMLRNSLGRVPDGWLCNYAHAVVDERGIGRAEGLQFVWPLSVETWKASIRWNGRLSGGVLMTTAKWLAGTASLSERQRRA